METLDSNFFEEFKALPENAKKQVRAYLKSIKKEIGGKAKDPKNYIPGHADQLSVSEDFEEYLVKNDLVSIIQSLPQELQVEFWQYLEKLKTKAQQISREQDPTEKSNKKFVPKAGFGGGKGFFILKEGWDDPFKRRFSSNPGFSIP